jgi:hypothetical protein
MAGELLYYLRDVPVPLYAWKTGVLPTDHYQMTRPFTAQSPEPVLFISLRRCPQSFAKSFQTFTHIGVERVMLVKSKSRLVHFCRLVGYKGE